MLIEGSITKTSEQQKKKGKISVEAKWESEYFSGRRWIRRAQMGVGEGVSSNAPWKMKHIENTWVELLREGMWIIKLWTGGLVTRRICCTSQEWQTSKKQSLTSEDIEDGAEETQSIALGYRMKKPVKYPGLDQQSSVTFDRMQLGRPGWMRSEMTQAYDVIPKSR